MYINNNEINTITNNMYDSVDSLKNEYKKIINQIQELKKGWKGAKSDAFYSYFENNYLEALEKSILEISKYADYLSKIPTTYQYLDDCYGNEIEV